MNGYKEFERMCLEKGIFKVARVKKEKKCKDCDKSYSECMYKSMNGSCVYNN